MPGGLTGVSALTSLSAVFAPAAAGGTGPPLSPLDWWDPDLGAYQDTGSTTPATSTNDPVALLTAQVGTIGNLTNSGGTDRPLLTASGVNGHGYLTFDGSNDFLAKTATAITKPCMVIIAVYMISWSSLDEIFGNTSAARGRLIQHASSPNIRLQTDVLGTEQSSPGLSVWAIISCRFTNGVSGDASFRYNNNARVTQDDGSGNFQGIQFGRAYNLSPANVRLGRMAVYSGSVSQSDEDTIVSNFMTYYGL